MNNKFLESTTIKWVIRIAALILFVYSIYDGKVTINIYRIFLLAGLIPLFRWKISPYVMKTINENVDDIVLNHTFESLYVFAIVFMVYWVFIDKFSYIVFMAFSVSFGYWVLGLLAKTRNSDSSSP